LLSTALRAGDWFIIPVFPSEYDLNGLQRLAASAKKIRERGNARLRLMSVLVGNYDKSTVLDEQIYTRLRQKFGEHLSKVRISRGVKIRESTSHHTTIFEHAGASDHAAQFLEFTREVIARMEKSLTEAPQREDQTTPASGPDATDELAVGEVNHG
jgi:cellulose biosynthesis protein BcsQ